MKIEDQISDGETLEFWKRYFDDYQDNGQGLIQIHQFCDAIQSEFYSNVIAQALQENSESLSEELLMSELNSGLRTKLSIVEEFVSINALELFTRDQGLTKALTNLV